MKRRLCSLILCLLLIGSLTISVFASDAPKVVDNAGLLTSEEITNLTARANDTIEQCQMDVVIVTVDSLDGKTVQEYADDYYDDNGYGYGDDYSGILFLIAMDTREWYMSTCGEAIYIFTDYGLDRLGEEVVPYLSSGSYFEAFDTWLYRLPQYCEEYRNGSPVDGYVQPDEYYPEYGDEIVYYEPEYEPNHLVSLLIGAVVALVVILIMRSQMNTAKQQKHAVGYMKDGSYHLRTCRDLYLYSRVTKTPKPQNNGGSRGGGSSVHRSSGGRSHGGRGGRF